MSHKFTFKSSVEPEAGGGPTIKKGTWECACGATGSRSVALWVAQWEYLEHRRG